MAVRSFQATNLKKIKCLHILAAGVLLTHDLFQSGLEARTQRAFFMPQPELVFFAKKRVSPVSSVLETRPLWWRS